MTIAFSLLGILLILGIAVLLSADRKAIRLRVVGAAFALQAGLAALVLYSPPGKAVLRAISPRARTLPKWSGSRRARRACTCAASLCTTIATWATRGC